MVQIKILREDIILRLVPDGGIAQVKLDSNGTSATSGLIRIPLQRNDLHQNIMHLDVTPSKTCPT
jgi:hypothetical protein